MRPPQLAEELGPRLALARLSDSCASLDIFGMFALVRLLHVIYLVAIGLAMAGWIWLMFDVVEWMFAA
jgi:hypothetical protein